MAQNKKPIFSVTKKDLEVSFFSGTGAGGQHRNRHQNCVRIKHIETGIIGTGQSQRSLEQNKKEALESLVANPKFMKWLKYKSARAIMGEEEYRKRLEALVDEQMQDKYLKIETYTPEENKNN